MFVIPWKQVLSDDEKRPIYDQYGEAGLKGAAAGGAVRIALLSRFEFYLFLRFFSK